MNREAKEKLVRLLRRKEELKKLYYDPSPKQLIFHSHPGRFSVILGSNRSGKSMALAYEAIWWALGCHPYKVIPFKPPVRLWIMVSTQEVGSDTFWAEKLKPIIPERFLARPPRKSGPYISQIEFTNGSVITLKSYEKGETALQSASVHAVFCDEQVPWSIYQELRQRISDINGHIYFAFTPLIPSKELQEYIEYRPQPEEKCDQADMSIVKITRYDNPVFANNIDEIKQAEASMSEQQARTRIYGDWLVYSGRLIPHFTDKSIVNDFAIPENWSRALMIDPATTGDAGAIWLAEDPLNGTWFQYKELLISGLAPSALAERIAKESSGKFVIKGYDTASAWFAAEARNNPFFKDSLVSVKKVGQNEAMVNVLNERFYCGAYKIFRSCQDTCKQIQAYVNKPNSIKFDPIKEDDHLVDCWKYWTQIHPSFAKPKRPQSYTEMLWEAARTIHNKPTNKDPNLGFI